jgi:parallel beta-helix repeat protein
MSPTRSWLIFIVLLCAIVACQRESTATPSQSIEITPTLTSPSTIPPTATTTATQISTNTAFPPTTNPELPLSIQLGQTNVENGISLDNGGDVDSVVVSVGNPAGEARSTGNGQALPSSDGNAVADSFLQFQVDDQRMFAGRPTTNLKLEVEYFDQGTDSFRIQYDAQSSSNSDGRFNDDGSVIKTGTGAFRNAVFYLCNANFANRDNGADFRISDDGNGPEIIRSVKISFLPPGAMTLGVDAFGASPFDDQPDSDAIQTALDQTCSGSTVIFTSGVNHPGYQGYLIDKTIFLTGMSAKHDMIYTSSDPSNHALLRATAGLKGFVVRLFARSRISNPGDIDNITFRNIDVNGGREVRRCMGADGKLDGNDDNWGSWLPECSVVGDAWCVPGNIGMDGAMDWQDTEQNYLTNPSLWSTGIVVENVVNSQVECGTSLALNGAAGIIRNVTVDTAGDHVHVPGCALTDNDEGSGGWSDGITFTGPGHLITGNTIINPSDVGIVFFGGQNTTISNNTVHITPGNYGAFAGIGIHAWIFGNNQGLQVTGNRVTNEGDTKCGGLHVGINIGPHMWGGGCVNSPNLAAVGNAGSCSNEPPSPAGQLCSGVTCQVWTYIPSVSTLTLRDNFVSGAQINYLVEGLDGEIEDTNNVSVTPRMTDWQAAKSGCKGITWGALDRVAHHPSLPGWTDMLIHCER